VFKVLRKADRMVYAMKEIDLAGMSRKVSVERERCIARGEPRLTHARVPRRAQEQEECIRETRVLSSLDSDFIIKYYDSFLERVRLAPRIRSCGARACPKDACTRAFWLGWGAGGAEGGMGRGHVHAACVACEPTSQPCTRVGVGGAHFGCEKGSRRCATSIRSMGVAWAGRGTGAGNCMAPMRALQQPKRHCACAVRTARPAGQTVHHHGVRGQRQPARLYQEAQDAAERGPDLVRGAHACGAWRLHAAERALVQRGRGGSAAADDCSSPLPACTCPPPPPPRVRRKLFIQILMGLNHMHSRKILHRDIKTLNVFLDDGLNVKLGDMGVAKVRCN
jgi:hypothetical protein